MRDIDIGQHPLHDRTHFDQNWVPEFNADGDGPGWTRVRIRNVITGECKYPTGEDADGQLIWPDKKGEN